MSQSLIANIQGLKELKEGEEVDIEVPPPTWNIEEKDQQENLQGVNRELGNPPDSSSPEGRVKIEGASQGYESSSKESVEEENNSDNRETNESIEEDEKGVEDNIGDCDINEEADGAVTVLKLSNGVMFRVPVEVQGMQLQAVVDTAAQVTLVSEEFYKSLDPAPPIRKEVVMNTAGKGMQMNGYIAGPFQVVLGTHKFSVEIYVAPIEENMLLGLDFLEANGVSLHLKEKELQIAGEVIPMSLGTGSPLVNEKETGVFLVKGCKVPPNSVMRVGAQLSESMAGEYMVKAATKGEMLIPRTLHKGGDNPVLCLINISDHYVELEKGEVLAYAEEVCSKVEPVGIQKVEVAEQEGQENGKREIPEHLTNLFEKSKGELNGQEQTQLSELLCEFEDVFALD